MKQIILFSILLIAYVSSETVSIGTCARFNTDGKNCLLCLPNYHLYDGLCFRDIPNCLEYKLGSICLRCSSKTTVLVDNQCCGSSCIQKLFQNQNNSSEQYPIEKNLQKVFNMIDHIEKNYIRNNFGKLVKISVKPYQYIERWFLVYEFQDLTLNYQRVILDYDLKKQTFIPIDFSAMRTPNEFSSIIWQDQGENATVLSQFSTLYPANTNYLQLRVKRAILSQIQQYQLLTYTPQKLEIREVYNNQNIPVIVQEVIRQFSSSSQSSIQTNSEKTLDTSSLQSEFRPYQLVFDETQINAQINANDGLASAVQLALNNHSWNHTLKKVTERGKSFQLTEFTIIGVNEISRIQFVINYNPLTTNPTLVSLNLQNVNDPTKATGSQNSSNKITQNQNAIILDRNNSSNSSNSSKNSKVFKQGSITHSSYTVPFPDDIQKLADKLTRVKNDFYLSQMKFKGNSSTPIIANSSMVLRRLVISQFCQGFTYKQITYVEGDSVSTKEYFTYYMEEDDGSSLNWYLLGTKNKTQSTTVFNNPNSYPIYTVDPSFTVYPFTTLYSQSGTLTNYLSNLTNSEKSTFNTLSINQTTQVNRDLGMIARFSVDGYDAIPTMYKASGWIINSRPEGLYTDGTAISQLCPESMLTESIVIGSKIPKNLLVHSQPSNRKPS